MSRPLTTRCLLVGALLAAGVAVHGAPRDIAADLSRAKVVILKSRETKRFGRRGAATAFMAAPGLALTAAHAIHDERETLAWLNGASYRTRLLAVDRERDLAVLRIGTGRLLMKPLRLAETSAGLQLREELLVVAGPSQGPQAKGEPRDRKLIPATFGGHRLQRSAQGKRFYHLRLYTAVSKGDSGSPVVRVRDGKVVGILVTREEPEDGSPSAVAYAAPIEWATPVLAEARKVLQQFNPDTDFYLLTIPTAVSD